LPRILIVALGAPPSHSRVETNYNSLLSQGIEKVFLDLGFVTHETFIRQPLHLRIFGLEEHVENSARAQSTGYIHRV
ncbi:hypothetical protein EV421DRAFT_2033702, partial [Armillaria borealis]